MGIVQASKSDSIAITLMSIRLDFEQTASLILVKHIKTDTIYISIGNITYETLKSVKLFIKEKKQSELKNISTIYNIEKYGSGRLDIGSTATLEKLKQLRVNIEYYNNQTTTAIITDKTIQEIIDTLKQ